MAAANDLRPVQARVNLELTVKRQLELRREETRILHGKCDALEAKLKTLKESFQDISVTRAKMTLVESDENWHADKTILPEVSHEDVLRWAEGSLTRIT